MENRPQSREENIKAGKSASVKRRGEGLGTGPVGNRGDGPSNNRMNNGSSKESPKEDDKPGQPVRAGFSSGGGGGRPKKSLLSIIGIIIVVIIVIVLLRNSMCAGSSSTSSNSSNSFATQATTAPIETLAGNNLSGAENYGLSALLGGYDYDNYYDNYNYSTYSGNSYNYNDYYDYNSGSGYDLETLLGSLSGNSSSSYGNYFNGISSAKWDANTGVLNTAVAQGTPEKFTHLKGNGNDTVTIMVYMCASDLESSGGAATMDIQEMLNASTGKNVNILLYTGGTRQWQNNVMSAESNQIYQIQGGQLYRLESSLGNKAMSDPNTLTEFINYCSTNFPADRNMLVLWDHGGGSVAGYAYDEKFKTSGYMSLAGINRALSSAGMKFDIIGFDTCLMATLENALMLSEYADYLVASEEVEPGTGWYYTDWLSDLSANTSLSSLELGKEIVDSFISESAKTAYGTGCTLSLVDLKELAYTVPDKLSAFAADLSGMLDSGSSDSSYSTVISARTSTREFGESQSLDQIDLVNFANNIGTASAQELADALKSAIKYNQVSANMSYSYGLSIFFPYNCINYVSKAADIYSEIGFAEEYTTCIKKAATITGNGQSIYGGYSSDYSYGSLLDALQGSNSYSSDHYSSSDISGFFSDVFFGRTITADDPACKFLADNHFDASQLVWTENANGEKVISLPEDQWKQVKQITLNTFYDDGEGYIDLGADNLFHFDEEGNLLGATNNTWLSIDEQIVAYYYDSMTCDDDYYSITGHVPVLVNGQSADIILVFDSSNPNGYIAGISDIYNEDDTTMVGKTITTLTEGDQIDFVADYYSYDGVFEDAYMIGDPWTYHDGAEIAAIALDGDARSLYRFTDIYNNHFWAPSLDAE